MASYFTVTPRRHREEETLLYQPMEAYYADILAQLTMAKHHTFIIFKNQ
jgi:hypothetical protein